jgi:membrane-associated phospholipid phosphatase
VATHDNSPSTAAGWQLRALFVLVSLLLWFFTQWLIGNRQLAGDGIVDLPLQWTGSIHRYLHRHPNAADALLGSSSLLIDCLGIFLLLRSIFGPTVRPLVGLLILFSLRQICQGLVALPAPPEMIWHAPQLGGVQIPSLLVTYGVANDFFFSGHTALAVYGAIELGRLGGRKLKLAAFLIAIFEMTAVLLLRAHWTMDVIAGLLAAICAALAADTLAPWCDQILARASARRTK